MLEIGIGEFNGFPFTIGGGESVKRVEHQALLDALSPAFDPSPGTAHYAELSGFALAISMIWAANKRLQNQAIPQRMIDALPDWEQILRLNPTAEDTEVTRRARVAAKLRGLGNNATIDIVDAIKQIAGLNFSAVIWVDSANQVNYWPGVNPGPPGLEWSSNRCRLAVKVTLAGLTNADYSNKLAALHSLLDSLCPAWMTWQIGSDSSTFTVNSSVVGQVFV